MALFEWRSLPNAITVGRIVLAPVVGLLLFVPTFTARFLAWVLFLVAAFSDLWDGHLARKYGWISDFGKFVDPIADKLLLATTFIPFYILSHRADPHGHLIAVGAMPMWILAVIFGREILITVIRSIAAKQGTVIPAGSSGKLKAVFQNIFVGTAIAWLAINSMALTRGWDTQAWEYWKLFHAFVFLTSLGIAIFLTVYSLVVYLWQWRRLMGGPPDPP
ncbi:MAG TPA: CDP-diacylglycerol--glycerol-3-phosphate 3-phosphatidyltransferase [Longimicrobiales bacterium]|nr:CDP-diacylglycerol--glycerol-3-phosphate 3-phosphatidyltransferase [Longimicrobiales bacterium]